MGLRIGGGFGLGPIGVGAGFGIGSGNRRNGNNDGSWLYPLLWAGALVLAIFSFLVLGILIICFSVGFLLAHLMGTSGLRSNSQRPWVSRILLCSGIILSFYLLYRGGINSAWSNFDFGTGYEYRQAEGKGYRNTWGDDWRVLLELMYWAFTFGLIFSTPLHWAICARHHTHRKDQANHLADQVLANWSKYLNRFGLVGIGIVLIFQGFLYIVGKGSEERIVVNVILTISIISLCISWASWLCRKIANLVSKISPSHYTQKFSDSFSAESEDI